ncbi:MAG TPA: ABC transporter permease [Thermoanaerobaculia bacterium]|jgi:predicted permease
MTTLLQDFRYALRTLVKSPGFAIVAIAILALGIGANAAMFALVNRVLLTSLPVRNPDELVLLRSEGPISGHAWSDDDVASSFTYPMYRGLRDRSTVFAGLVAEYPFAASLAAGGQTERANGELVSGNAFDVLGVTSALGRPLTPGDDRVPGAHAVAVLSHAYWTRRFGADPAILDRTMVINGHPYAVVGVAREGFTGVQPGRPADVFVPMMEKAQVTPFRNGLDDPKDYWVQIFGRLKPGRTRSEAEREVAGTYRALLQEAAVYVSGWTENSRRKFVEKKLELLPGGHGRRVMRNGIGTPLLSLMGMVTLVLLIACSNLAGLLAARGAARQKEYGIRLAIGASRGQLLRQSVIECLLFSALGGTLGLGVASWTLRALLSAYPPDSDLRLIAVQMDPRIVVFVAGLSILSALFFGVTPTLRAARLDPASTLRGAGRGGSPATREALRFRRLLVTAQIALTLVLLVAAGLFTRSIRNLGHVDLGLKPEHVIGFTVSPELNGYSAGRTALFGRQLIENMKALPGVRSATAAVLPTFTNDTSGSNLTIEGRPETPGESIHVRYNAVAPDYFSTLGIPRLQGRGIAWSDGAATPKVAVVNESLAKKFFAERGALGARIGMGAGKETDIEIVGVVRDSKGATVDEKAEPFVYLPIQQDSKLGELTFYARAEGDPAAVSASLRAEVRRLDPDLPLFDLKTLTTQLHESLLSRRLVMILSTAFGALAALLAALGIYGVLAFGVAQRRREIGVRIALGATPAVVRRLVLSEVGRLLAIGGLVGLPVAIAVGRAVRSILFGVPAADVATYAGGVVLLAAVALAAAYPPARRAARTNALDALRSE